MSYRPIPMLTAAEFAKFMSKVEITANCWKWKGKWSNSGGLKYGNFMVKRDGKWSNVRAHRITKSLLSREDNQTLEVHHACKNTLCVNPDHLEWITVKDHRAKNRRTHCKYGHELERHTGRSRCNVCKRAYFDVRILARRGQLVAAPIGH